jgi:vacuolar-type H+-ATPase subunit H
MDTVVLEDFIHTEQWLDSSIHSAIKSNKKSFEEASAECNAVSLDTFITELKQRVKERYQNAKSQDIRNSVG